MKDDALSPVIAFMMLLMIIVSFISLLNAYYIPSLKQQSEIEHLHNVEETFLHVSPNIFHILSFRQNVSMSEPVQLGGGDILLSPLKSSGYINISPNYQKKELPTIKLLGYNGTNMEKKFEVQSSICPLKIEYCPSGNFWINQKYKWIDGIIYIQKGSNEPVALQYINNIKIYNETKRYYDSLLPSIAYNKDSNNITSMQITLINIIKTPDIFISGNGFATLNFRLIQSFNENFFFDKYDYIKFEIYDGIYSSDYLTSIFSNYFDRTKNCIDWDEKTKIMTLIQEDKIEINVEVWDLAIYIV